MLFEDVTAHAPSTLMSHASLLSSLIPQHHGASHYVSLPLSPEVLTLAEILLAHGWTTSAVHGGGQLASIYGLAQGFSEYMPEEGRFEDTVAHVRTWLTADSTDPLFLFLHSYEVHHPYTPQPEHRSLFESSYAGPLPAHISIDLLQAVNSGQIELSSDDLDHIVAAYDAEISSMDAAFNDLVGTLKAENLYENAFIIFTSDHGEEFGEHGYVGWHSHTLYQELLRVPLLVKLPGGRFSGATISTPARLIDVMPTILEVLGIDQPQNVEGESLLPLLTSDRRQRLPTIAKRDTTLSVEVEALRLGSWKWANGELFDLSTDPGETNDLALEHPDRARLLKSQLDRLTASRRAPLAGERVIPDQQTRTRLRALGYLD